MTYNYSEQLQKFSKWTDAIKKDNRFYGFGTVENQIHAQNGSVIKKHSFEDRSFGYELKENQIFAYGILDGYNGNFAVDLLEQVLLTNLYFDHLNNLNDQSDEEIYKLLDSEINDAEQYLSTHSQNLLRERAHKTVLLGEYRRGTAEYFQTLKEIKQLDEQINVGAFALISVIVNDRLFVTNVGTNHCFLCLQEDRKLKINSLETPHVLKNSEEFMRIKNLNESLTNVDESDKSLIHFTRCLGDFKLKLFYHEYPQFKSCTAPPVISKPQHFDKELKIDDSFLFMAMCSNGLIEALEKINDQNEDLYSFLTKKIIDKLLNEPTLNSAVQSVLDEIKRNYDDKFSNEYHEREDFTLVVRVFDLNIKKILESILIPKKSSSTDLTFDEGNLDTLRSFDDEIVSNVYDSVYSGNESSISYNETNTSNTSDKEQKIEDLLDENGNVKAYVKFDQLNDLLSQNENKNILDKFYEELENLGIS